MQEISALPDKKGIIGAKEIARAIQSGRLRRVIVASNCPDFLISRISHGNIVIERFNSGQKDLGTKLGKPFPVAMVGYEE